MRHSQHLSPLSTEPAPSSRLRPRTWLPFVIAAGVLLVDQVTKSLAESRLDGPTHVIGPIGFGLTYNSGSAFSLFQGSAALLAIFDVLLAIVIAVIAVRVRRPGLQVGLGMMLGGALGNLADRLVRGHHGQVVDFITLSHWPTFNLADAAIDIGVLVVIISLLMERRSSSEPKEADHAR